MGKKVMVVALSFFFLLLFTGAEKVEAAYTNTGWDWQSIPPGPNGTSYGSVNPNGGNYASSVNALAVRIKSGTTPTANFTYTPEDAAKDPWGKGNITVSWSGTVVADVNIWNAITQVGKGLGFVAHVNLPQTVFAGDVQNAIVNATTQPKIRIGNTDVQLSSKNFVPIGPHTLRLTMTKNNISNLSSQLVGIVLGGADMNNLSISFSITVPVSQITANGAWNSETDKGYYTGMQYYLTTNRFPPMKGKTDEFSIDFYGYDDINEGGNSYGGGTGYYYAKLNADKTFIPKNRVYSQTPIKSWDKFISPRDHTGFYNTQGTVETVDGSNKGFGIFSFDSDNLRQYSVDLNPFDGTWSQINQAAPNRFDRVVDFFTMKSVPGINLTHTPATSPGIGKNVSVLYTGNDLQGTPLTPVKLRVGETYSPSDIKVNNVTTFSDYTNGKPATAVLANAPMQLNISWKAPSLKTGKIVYRVLDPGLNTVVNETTFIDKIANTASSINNYQTVTGTIGKLPVGIYLIEFKIVDDAYPNQNDYMADTKSALVTAVSGPDFTVSNSLTNSRTGESNKSSISALWEDPVKEEVVFSVKDAGSVQLKEPYVQVAIPPQTTFVPGTLAVTVNGKAVDVSGVDVSKINTGTAINLPANDFKAGDEITVDYQYKLGDIANQEVRTQPVSLGGKIASKGPDGKDVDTPILPFNSTSMGINVPSEALQFIQVPTDFSFGKTPVPYKVTDIPIDTKNFEFKVNNTRVGTKNSQWEINATLSKEFHTSDGHVLNAESTNLVYDDRTTKHTIVPNQSTPIYSYTGKEKGNITIDLPGALTFHVDPTKLTEGVETDSPYQCEVTWGLTNGPTN